MEFETMKNNKVILLTSCGFSSEKIREEFKKLFSKNMEQLKVLYIPVAADVEEDNEDWVQEEFQYIIDLGINKENVTEYRFDYELDVKQFDFIYMLGGNTFYLLKKVRESNFDTKISDSLKKGIIYVGSSAGSIIMGNTVETSRDENKYVNDFIGLKHFNGIVIPHANKRKEYIEEQKKKFSDKIYSVEDGSGILIVNDNIKVI